ncbi:MAG: HDOD domain-containing protein [Desulfocapsaceae bacterium]|nr:HDOD domain-containing protein [Desulfocapsaceae bacterium]
MTQQIPRYSDVPVQVQRPRNLPPIPEILLTLLKTFEHSENTLEEYADIIIHDPALSFRIMQVASTGKDFGRGKPLDIAKSLAALGIALTQKVVQNAAIHQVFERKRLKKAGFFNHYSFWYHSQLCAVLSRRFARKIGYPREDEAYLVGLLHDIGRLALVSAFPQEHEAILQRTQDKQNLLWAEEQLLGMTHCRAGAQLLQQWQPQLQVVDALQYHHESLEQINQAFPLVKITYLANLLSEEMQLSANTSEAGKLLFKLNDHDLEKTLQRSIEEVSTVAAEFDMHTRDIAGSSDCEREDTSEEEDKVFQTISSSAIRDYPVAPNIKSQIALISRIKNISMLSGLTERCINGDGFEEILFSFENSLNILFNLHEVMFFLPDNTKLYLKGTTSLKNPLNDLAEGLFLPINESTSKIQQTYTAAEQHTLNFINLESNLADTQLLDMLGGNTLLLLPIPGAGETIGVALMALPPAMQELSKAEMVVLRSLVKQLGTNLHNHEIASRQAAKQEAEQMEMLSTTVKKVAHEINNPIGIINNYLKIINIKYSENTELQNELTIVGEELERISTMVNQMDMLSSTQHDDIEPLDINEVLTGVIELSASTLFGGINQQLLFKPGDDLPTVGCSVNGLKQIMLNLLKNSSEAIGPDGKVEVTTRAVADSEKTGERNGQGVEIIVEDNGPGLPDKILENLYKPFISTKKKGHAGLGLSIVHTIVTRLNGSITCESDANEGTRFILYFGG